MAVELFDPAGQANDAIDPLPYPAYVPAGFTTSSDSDFLTFRTGSVTPTSDTWSDTILDGFTDLRDFIDFFDGTLLDGAAAQVTFGLFNDRAENEAFILSQRPNVFSQVPAPAPVGLPGLGLPGLGLLAMALRRRAGR